MAQACQQKHSSLIIWNVTYKGKTHFYKYVKCGHQSLQKYLPVTNTLAYFPVLLEIDKNVLFF